MKRFLLSLSVIIASLGIIAPIQSTQALPVSAMKNIAVVSQSASITFYTTEHIPGLNCEKAG